MNDLTIAVASRYHAGRNSKADKSLTGPAHGFGPKGSFEVAGTDSEWLVFLRLVFGAKPGRHLEAESRAFYW